MLLAVFLHEETRFACKLLLSEILLHQWLQFHNPNILFEVFFKVVAKCINFHRIIFDVLWAGGYSRKIKLVENSFYVACCVAFPCFFLNEFGEFFCFNRAKILVRCAGFVCKVLFQPCKSFFRQRRWSSTPKTVFDTARLFVLRNQSAYR